jgi:hypothetical protein
MWLKWIAAAALVLFVLYTAYCTRTESFWKSAKAVFELRWGRQVVIDLYLGLGLFACVVYWNEQSILIATAWFVAMLIFGNITTLLYFVMNFEALFARFM